MPSAQTTSSQVLDAGAALAAFEQHYEGLLRFLRQRTGCADTACELAHETWLRLVMRSHCHADACTHTDTDTAAAFAPLDGAMPARDALGHDPARAYIYTVGARLALNRQRDQGRYQRLIGPHDEGGRTSDGPPVLHAGPARTHELRQALAAIEQHLHQLPLRQRQVLLAHRLDGVPQAELAQRHGVSLKTIERDIAAGMNAIEAALHQWRGDTLQGRARTHNRGRRRTLTALIGLGALGSLTLMLRQWLGQAGGPAALQWALQLDSDIGQIKHQPLPDGSHITLNAASALHLRYFDSERQAELTQGAAFFSIAADSARPFVVHTALAQITVVGTRFGVDWRGTPEAPQLRIAVQSGQVRVQPRPIATHQPPPAPLLLGAGQEIILDAQGQANLTTMAHPEDAAAWKNGWLLFQNEPLGAAIQRLARYHRPPIRLAPEAAALPVLGRVRITQARQWLRLLPQTLPVRVHENQDGSFDITRTAL